MRRWYFTGYLLMAAGLTSLASLPIGKRAARLPAIALLAAAGIAAVYSYVAYTGQHPMGRR